MSLVSRILNCLNPVNPELTWESEVGNPLSYFLKLAGVVEAAYVIFISEGNLKKAMIGAAVGAGLYLTGAVKDYLYLRRMDRFCAEDERLEKELTKIFGKPGTYLSMDEDMDKE
jgi:hypothetical protein